MLASARDVPPGSVLHADVAIVGGGPAGITLALELMGSGLSVLLLEAGGGAGRGRGGVDAFHGEVADASRHPPIDLYRRQGLGGTSSVWGGRCVPFDPIDFEPRSHVPWSGWPIGYDDVLPFYRRAMDHCHAGPFHFRVAEALGPDAAPMVPGFRPPEIDIDGVERFSLPTDFGRAYRRPLANSPTTTVLLHSTCIGLDPTPSGTGIAALRVAAEPGRTFTVRARRHVLAAGGLETARLLLAAGVGNRFGHVGRFYMCHLEGKAAMARFPAGARVIYEYERDRGGVYLRRFFSFAAALQREQAMTNIILRFEPPVVADPAHGNPVLSAMYLVHALLQPEYSCKLGDVGSSYDGAATPAGRLGGHIANVAGGLPQLARFSAGWAVKHWLARRKQPYLGAVARDGTLYLDFNAEQTPNPDSRVTLSGARDAYGVPRLHVAWRVCDLDIASVSTAYRLIAAALNGAGAGRLTIDEDEIRDGYRAMGGHHIGTARMAEDASLGVVDRNCRVFDLDNLFVAGSAVFPTSSHANPTLTIVALATRLADHLKALARSASDRLPMAAE